MSRVRAWAVGVWRAAVRALKISIWRALVLAARGAGSIVGHVRNLVRDITEVKAEQYGIVPYRFTACFCMSGLAYSLSLMWPAALLGFAGTYYLITAITQARTCDQCRNLGLK